MMRVAGRRQGPTVLCRVCGAGSGADSAESAERGRISGGTHAEAQAADEPQAARCEASASEAHGSGPRGQVRGSLSGRRCATGPAGERGSRAEGSLAAGSGACIKISLLMSQHLQRVFKALCVTMVVYHCNMAPAPV